MELKINLYAGAGEKLYNRFCSNLDCVAQDFAQYNGKGNSAGLQVGNWDLSSLDIISDIAEISEPNFYEENIPINGFRVD